MSFSWSKLSTTSSFPPPQRPQAQGRAVASSALARWSLQERLEVLQRGAFPVAACDALLARGLALPMDLYPQWSGYALYRLHPPLRVLVDGRLVFAPDVAELMRRRFAGDVGTFDAAEGRYHTVLLL